MSGRACRYRLTNILGFYSRKITGKVLKRRRISTFLSFSPSSVLKDQLLKTFGSKPGLRLGQTNEVPRAQNLRKHSFLGLGKCRVSA